MTGVVVPFSGWGRGGWGELAFGEGSVAPGAAIGQVGTLLVEGGTKILLLGLAATGQVGGVRIIEGSGVTVLLTGQQMRADVGRAFVWGRVDPNQDPNYVNVVPNQDAGYVQITPNQEAGWTRLVA